MGKSFFIILITLFGSGLLAETPSVCTNSLRMIEKKVRQAARYYHDVYLSLETKYRLPISFKKLDSFSEEPVIEVIRNRTLIKTKGFVIFKNRIEGIRQLLRISRTSNTELGWVYLPSHQVWINVAISVDETGVKFHEDMLRYLPLGFEALELFHIHPLNMKTGLEPEYLVVPSYEDLSSAMALNSVVDRAKHGFGIFTSSIVSPFGLTTIRQNPRVIDQNYAATYRINHNVKMRGNLQNALRVIADAEKNSEVQINNNGEVLRPFQFEFTPADKL